MPAPSNRARSRAELYEKIKAHARHRLATDGANLSLRAVARDVGMVPSGLYRYFASRDDLLTALIVDAYNALGDAAEAADTDITDRTDLRGRWLAICHAVRRWAQTHPAEYALIFGSPVPGYAAPHDTITPAMRTTATLVRILADGTASEALKPPDPTGLPSKVRADLARLRRDHYPTVPEPLLARGTIAWIHLFGAVSFETFGQLDNLFHAREAYFDHQMQTMADFIGI